MNAQERLQSILTRLTPGYLRQVILDLAASQAPGDRAGVSLTPIIDALTGGQTLGTGSEGWQAYLALKQAIVDTVARISDMRYVEGDA